MVLAEYLKTIPTDEIIYLGCDSIDKAKFKSNGSGFVFIGCAKNAPIDKFGQRIVRSTYPHECDYGGMTVIIEGIEAGKYWFWHDEDPSVPLKEIPLQTNPEPFENLLVAIARQTITDYRLKLKYEIRRTRPTHMMEVDDVIRFCRRNADLEFLKGSNVGEYMIQAVEDEERIFWMYPKARKMDPEKKAKFIDEKRAEIIKDRLKKAEKKLYAKIKGRSIKHDTDR